MTGIAWTDCRSADAVSWHRVITTSDRPGT